MPVYTWSILHITWQAGLESDEGGMKVGERNIRNLRYADDIMLLEENSNQVK